MAKKKNQPTEMQQMTKAAYDRLQKKREKLIEAAVLKQVETYLASKAFEKDMEFMISSTLENMELYEVLGDRQLDKFMKLLVEQAFPQLKSKI